MTGSPLPRLRVRTREATPSDDLAAAGDPAAPLLWVRRGDGMAGRGVAVRLEASASEHGPRAASLARDWRALAAAADIDDPVRLPGTGLIGFATLAFDERSGTPSAVLVPRRVYGRRDGRGWVTEIDVVDGEDAGAGRDLDDAVPYGPYWSATLGPGAQSPEGYQDAVARALAAIAGGEVGKVVMARDLVGTVPAEADLRRLTKELAANYPDTWVYAVDGMIGASPETLVTAQEGRVTARVLAGTRPRGADAAHDAAVRDELLHSAKDLDEHGYAVRSVWEALAPHTSAVTGDPRPFALELPNLWHLATDVEGILADRSTSLDLVQALHPTAAVAGTPRDAALEVIRRLEPFDRGRYAGPVGWIDARGDGEWAIALRGAQFGPAAVGGVLPVTACAGAGIVTGSDPEQELLETRVKFRPIVDALA